MLLFENVNCCRFLGPKQVITAYFGDFDAPQSTYIFLIFDANVHIFMLFYAENLINRALKSPILWKSIPFLEKAFKTLPFVQLQYQKLQKQDPIRPSICPMLFYTETLRAENLINRALKAPILWKSIPFLVKAFKTLPFVQLLYQKLQKQDPMISVLAQAYAILHKPVDKTHTHSSDSSE